MIMIAGTGTTDLTPPAPLSLREEGGEPGGSLGRSGLAVTIGLAMFLATLLLAGCGGEDTIAGSSPQATAENFIEAMQVGDYEKIAAGRDYETWAAQENPDWETFSQRARDLIVGKLQEEEAQKMAALAGMFTGEASVGDVQEQGNTATVIINAGANSLELEMNNLEGKWYVYSVEERTQ